MSQIRIAGGALAVTLTETDRGAGLTALQDGDICIYSGEVLPFFGLGLKFNGEELRFLSHTDFAFFSSEILSDGMCLRFSAPGGFDGIDVIISVTAENHGLRFESFVNNSREDCSITEVEYPRFWFVPSADSRCFCPTGCGLIMDNLHLGPHRRRMRYPSYQASMSYCAIYDCSKRRGIYIGYEDTTASLKHMMIRRGEEDTASCLSCALPARNLGQMQNSQPIPGVCVWRTFSGDWYDAALEYKHFALRAPWTPETDTLGLRKHRNDRIWECGHWWLDFFPDDGSAPDITPLLTLSQKLGVPCAVHIYRWHTIPFDNDYPHFFPEKPTCRPYLQQLRNAGLLTMPYINGRLWDTRDRGMEDYQFSSVAKPHVTKDENNEPITEWCSVKEPDGSYVLYGIMCPTTQFWQDKVSELARRVLDGLGSDGLYIDQIASAPPRMCCDPDHLHAPGNGSWWIDGYRTLSERVVRENSSDKFLTSEGTTETYFNEFDAFLGWSWWYNGQIPALAAVYGGIALCFGRQYGDVDDDTMRILAAQAFTFGEQMGWITTERFSNADISTQEFYTSCVQLSYAHRSILRLGELCRPPKITTESPQLRGHTCAEDILSAPVLASIWRNRGSGACRLFLACPARECCTFSLCHESIRGELHFSGTHSIRCHPQDNNLSLTLPAGAVIWANL